MSEQKSAAVQQERERESDRETTYLKAVTDYTLLSSDLKVESWVPEELVVRDAHSS